MRPRSRDHMQGKLAAVEDGIHSHPFLGENHRQAQSGIEGPHRGDKEAVQRELTDRSLLPLEEVGKLTLKHTLSWWNLHRKRNRLRARLSRSEG